MNIVEKLGNWVEVTSGITSARDGNTPCRILPAKWINANGINYSKVEKVYATSKIKPLERNDVLVVNRGRFSVALVGDDLPRDDITLPSFVFTLRPKNRAELLPEYLYCYLNTKKIQNKLKAIQQGGSIQFISRTDLKNLTIEIPDLKTQKSVANLYKNILKLQQAKQKQIKLLDQYMNAIVTEVIKND